MQLEKIPRRTQLTIVFLVTTALISTVTALDTLNYTQYFPALEQLRVNVSSLQYQPTNSSLNGNVTFEVQNPTSYTGLGLQSLTVNFTIIANDSVNIPQGIISFVVFPSTLDPGLTVNYTLPIDGSGEGPQTVTQILKNGGTIRFVFSLEIFLKTFLDAIYLTSIPYECQGPQVPSSCDQVGVLIRSQGGVGAGGGGR